MTNSTNVPAPPPEPPEFEDASLQELQRELAELQIAEFKARARARLQAPQPEPIVLLGIEEILAQPDPEWLIDGLLQDDSFAILFGPSDTGKKERASSRLIGLVVSRPAVSGFGTKRKRVRRFTCTRKAATGSRNGFGRG